jgi:hypothetical protein
VNLEILDEIHEPNPVNPLEDSWGRWKN